MQGRITWIGGVGFVARSGSGHNLLIDGAPETGGQDYGCRPMELVLLGLGGCTAIDVVTVLRKSRQAVDDCVIDLHAERAETVPKVFSRIHLHFTVTGKGLNPDRVARAIRLSAEKYCSVSAMLEKTATITHDFEIIEARAQA